MAVLIALIIIVLRYWLLPDIEQYHTKITDSLAGAIGHPVTIGSIKGDWQGLQPHLSFFDVHILNEQQQPVLVLPRIDGSVSWMSLFTADLRLASLDISRPELLVHRDAQGNLFVGDVEFSSQGGDNTLADWLLHQSRVVVRDALIVWVDEQRDAPPLVLQQVNLHIENLFNHHRFALRALPPNELATPLDVRGDFNGASFDDFKKWRGRIFTQLDYTDVTAWRTWLDLPGEFSQGRGALRGWLSIEGGKMTEIIADLDWRDVVTQLGEDAPEMVLLNLRGRAAWKDVPSGMEISTEKLAMRLQNGIELQPTDFYFRSTQASDEQPASGEMRVNLLQLEHLAGLAKYLPLEFSLRDRLDGYAPSGRVSNLNAQWQGALEKPDRYKFKGQFENIAVHQVGKMPGFSGLTADVDGSDTDGRLNITSRQVVVDAPGIMREPLFFSILTGQVGWRTEQGELSVNVDNVAVANDDLSGNLYGSYHTQAGTRGVLDLTGSLTRGDIRRAARYTPLIALNQEGNDWLNGALLAGHTEDFSIRIKGNLSDFPIRDETKDVLFNISGHARDVVLEFAKDWPRIENITGEFLIRGNKLEVIAPSATMASASLQNVDVTLPDVTSDDLALEINGEAVAGNEMFLQFVQQSPVRGYIDGFTDGVRASGNGHLALFARIPLKGDQPVQVSGNLHVRHSDIDLGAGVPWLRNTSGVLAFTESGMQANGISSEILGGTASINVQTAKGGTVHATVRGRSNLDTLRKSEAHPLLNYLRGGAAWDADISVVNKTAQITINSDLRGISSALPQPFAKRANESMPLRFEKAHVAAGQDLITARLGSLLSVRLERSDAGGEMAVKRGTVNFGAQDKKPDDTKTRKRSRQKDGVWVTGNVPVLSVEGWGGVLGATGKAGSALPITGINLSVGKLIGYGQTVGALQINAAKRGDGLAAKLAGKALSGEVAWLPRGYKAGGKLSARLRSLHLAKDTQPERFPSSPKPATPAPAGQDKDKPADVLRPGAIPALEIAIESLEVKGNPAGRFELVGYPDGKDWRLRRLNITNPDGSLAGDGIWRAVRGGTQTEVNLQLALTDAGKILARSGYPDSVKGGSGKLAANLSWAGTPDKFDYATLNGTLKLDAGKGQFLKMEPGAGKLLSILSMQALPKHVTTLDFTDVFSKGFQFDNIIGEAAIKNGVMDTQEFHIYGSAAKVALKGSVDLNRETQNLNVKVFPAIGDSVALLAVFAINPAAGIAGLIADKLLGSPLDKLVSFEYNVDGTWSDPNVVKIGGSTAKEKNNLN